MPGPSALPPPGVCTPDQLTPTGEPLIGTPCKKWTAEQAGPPAAKPSPPAPPKDEAEVAAKGEAAGEYSFLDDPVRWVREGIQGVINDYSPMFAMDEIGEAVDGAGKPQE